MTEHAHFMADRALSLTILSDQSNKMIQYFSAKSKSRMTKTAKLKSTKNVSWAKTAKI